MKKYLLFQALIFACLPALSSVPEQFHKISPPEMKIIEIPEASHSFNQERKAPQGFSIYKATLPEIPRTKQNALPRLKKTEEIETSALDSIIIKNVDGQNMTKQVFEYSKDGYPLKCLNYTAGRGDNWVLSSYYVYEYDAKGRVTMRESVGVTDHSTDERYEYFYSDDSDKYSSIIYSIYGADANGFEPYQKGEYTYDSYGYPAMELYSVWNDQDWLQSYKIEFICTSEGVVISQFAYNFNNYLKEWVGADFKDVAIFDTEFDTQGRISAITKYRWADNKWVNLVKRTYQYNSNGAMTREDYLVWNADLNSWSGCYQGEFGSIDYNYYVENKFNDDGRIISAMVYRSFNTNGNYILQGGDQYAWIDLGESNLECDHLQVLVNESNGPLTPYMRDIQRFNKYGTEYYFKRSIWMNDEEVNTQAEERDFDEYNNFLGARYFGFNNEGERYGEMMEEYIYADDYDPASRLFTPIEGTHYMGTSRYSEDSWSPYQTFIYEWDGPRSTFRQHLVYLQSGNSVVIEESDESYYTDKTYENTFAWPGTMSNYGCAYRMYSYRYNDEYFTGNINWSPEDSYTEYYYYNDKLDPTVGAVTNIETDEIREVVRYDITGKRIASSVKGINIIKYSDGSVKKVMIK